MAEIVGLEFRYLSEIHYAPLYGFEVAEGDWVIARTRRGKEIARVKHVDTKAEEDPRLEAEPFVRKLLRPVEAADHEREDQNRIREAQAIRIGDKKVELLGLPMRLVRVHYLFDHSRILFYFKAPHKVDFRELVRELAAVFKTRIELRQIGVRDEAKILGGVGVCGRELCCTTWMRDFFPVTVRMAKDQHLSLNPTNISGVCGRLKCCLIYEQPFYEVSMRGLPPLGSIVLTSSGPGKLLKTNIFQDVAEVLTEDSTIRELPLDEIRGQGGRIAARGRGVKAGRRRGEDRRGGDAGRRGEEGAAGTAGDDTRADGASGEETEGRRERSNRFEPGGRGRSNRFEPSGGGRSNRFEPSGERRERSNRFEPSTSRRGGGRRFEPQDRRDGPDQDRRQGPDRGRRARRNEDELDRSQHAVPPTAYRLSAGRPSKDDEGGGGDDADS